ncbi:MAG: restriction endonuclease subunit S, partial [Caldilineaceae bacterium]
DGLIALVNMQDDVYTEFLYYSLLYNKEALFAVATHGGAYSNLTTSIVRDFKLVLPSLAEQRKIAAILSTWDEAIDLTEQLIAAKQRRKQALMQRLLTGQVRFPGFEEEWTRNKLQNITTIDYGKSPNEIRDDNGCFYIWGTGGIVGKTNTILCQSPAVIIGRKGTIDKPILAEEPFWTIDTTFYCLPKPGNNVQWLYYALSQIDLKQYNEASGVPSLSRNTLYNIEMQVPPIAEQGKIAEIFLTCDKELALHQQKLTALRRQKQGLMQQLLTGRVRVVG